MCNVQRQDCNCWSSILLSSIFFFSQSLRIWFSSLSLAPSCIKYHNIRLAHRKLLNSRFWWREMYHVGKCYADKWFTVCTLWFCGWPKSYWEYFYMHISIWRDADFILTLHLPFILWFLCLWMLWSEVYQNSYP